MTSSHPLVTDLVLSPFGASSNELIDVAKCAEDSGFNGIWTLDPVSYTHLTLPTKRKV